MLIEAHFLQSFPVSNLNRDDIGQPKTANFGGYTRARISSQSQKRAARKLFERNGLEGGVSWQTKRLCEAAAKLDAKPDTDLQPVIELMRAGLATLGFNTDGRGLNDYLIKIDPSQAPRALAEYCCERAGELAGIIREREDWLKKEQAKAKRSKTPREGPQSWDYEKIAKEAAKKLSTDNEAVAARRRILDASDLADVAMFGRMIASNTDFSIVGASQVAHAISTHEVANDFDFYTAIDELKPSDSKGAEMVGTIDFNAACYYRYLNLDLNQLRKNLRSKIEGETPGDRPSPAPEDPRLEDLVHRSAKAWLKSFIEAVPTGKQSTMAAPCMPDTLLVVVREQGSWSLANAFLSPVGRPKDLMLDSTLQLTDYLDRLLAVYGDDEIRSITYCTTLKAAGYSGPKVTETGSAKQLVNSVLAAAEAAAPAGKP